MLYNDVTVEEMDGRWMGVYNRTVGLQQLHQIFQKNFPQSSTSTSSSFGMNNSSSTSNTFSAVCLGIAGDTSPNVLWRLMHGEMPNDFHPKIWWLSLGMNDLTRTQVCLLYNKCMNYFLVIEVVCRSY